MRDRRARYGRREDGVSLIETLIVVAVIGIATAMAIPMYQVYSIRAQVAQGLSLAVTHKSAVAGYNQDHGTFPVNNAAAQLALPEVYGSKYVAAIAIDGPRVSIEFGNRAHQMLRGRLLYLTASNAAGSFTWDCSSEGAIQDDHLPPACR